MLAKALLDISTFIRRWAIAQLNRQRMTALSPDDGAKVRELTVQVLNNSRQIQEIISATLGNNPGQFSSVVFHLSGTEESSEGVIIFDMADGSHCYRIDPPGICCCDPC